MRGILAPVPLGSVTEMRWGGGDGVGQGVAESSGEFVTYFSVPPSARTSF